ncbi:outer membrane protein assembly factor BamA [Simkania negevensis]|uniref:Outer membrane protein assembly factor BamA n=1 Tax=Simkania negevensis TaxID=83561 RepID=A0ABS3AS90_9BACT|nr:outer membrane protein assembly factor BamA [Simkania negevensis]
MKTFFSFLYVFLFCSSFSCFAEGQQYEGKDVASVVVTVADLPADLSFDKTAFLSRMKTQAGHRFSQTDFDQDLKTLSKDYEGVSPKIVVKNDELYITLTVALKPMIRKILWRGNDHFKDYPLQKKLDIDQGVVYDREAFNEGFHKLRTHYVKKGFFEAQLNYKLIPLPGTNEVDVEITVEEGRSGRIKEILFQGFTKKEEDDLLSMIMTKEYNLFTSWVTHAGTYHEEMVEQDKYTIINFLQNEGYAAAKVEINIRDAKDKNRILVEVVAERGERYYFGPVTFAGNKVFDEAVIDSLIVAREGGVYSPDKVRDTVQNITNYYGERGYIETIVDYEASLEQGRPVYDVNLSIEEGKKFRVGLVRVFGNTSTQTPVILHETLLVPGEVFDIRKLKATEQRLRNIGYFENVNVYAVNPAEGQNVDIAALAGLGEEGEEFRPVYIEVEETNTGSFSIFFGFSTLDSLFGGVEIVERNFNIRGINGLLSEGPIALRGGGEYMRLRFNVAKKNTQYLLSWTKPYFMDTQWTVGFDVEKSDSRQQSDDYALDSLSFSLHASHPINDYLSFSTHYRIKNTDVRVSDSASQALRDEANNDGVISAVGASIIYDSIDNPFSPRRGFRSQIEAEFAGLGGRSTFLSCGYLNTYYLPISSRGTLKYRADLRFLFPLGSTTPSRVPLGERFFLGGETTVRGYRGYIIGPKYSNGDPKGGITSLLLSEEYQHVLNHFVDAFVFFDVGTVTLEKGKLGALRASYGLGLRINIMNQIPLTLGYGVPLNAESRSDERKFFLSLGGRF